MVGEVFESFSRVSGARVNRAKSSVLFAGAWAGPDVAPGGFTVAREGIKILGVVFGVAECAKFNWNEVVRRVKRKVGMWAGRDLCLSGRVMVAKMDVLPLINYLAGVFPVPFVLGRSLERVIFQFIWKWGPEWVARAVMTRAVRKGGRGVIAPMAWANAMFVAKQVLLVLRLGDHKAHFLAYFWLGVVLRGRGGLSTARPWSLGRPWFYQKVADLVHRRPELLEEDKVLKHREVYRVLLLEQMGEAGGMAVRP